MWVKDLKGCDKSDMKRWAQTAMADNLIREIEIRRTKALKELIKHGNEQDAAVVRAFDFVNSLFREAREGK